MAVRVGFEPTPVVDGLQLIDSNKLQIVQKEAIIEFIVHVSYTARILPRKRARRSSRFEKYSMSYTKGHELGADEGATEDNDEHDHRPRIQRLRWRTFPYSSGDLQTVGSQYRFSPSPLHSRTRRVGLRSTGGSVSSSKASVSDTPDSRKRLRPSPITDCKWRSVTEIGRRAIPTRPVRRTSRDFSGQYGRCADLSQ